MAGTAGNFSNWLEMAENEWNGLKLLKMAGNCLILLEMATQQKSAGMAGNGWKCWELLEWLKIDGNG